MVQREWADAEYSRIYWTVVDDPKFAEVFDDDRRWAAYTRLLMAAEATYPSAAPLPRWLADDVLAYLIEVRIIEVVRGSSYRIVALKAEREGRVNGNAIGGKKRSEDAERDEFGRFLPSNPTVHGEGVTPQRAESSEAPATQPAKPAIASVRASVEPARPSSRPPADPAKTRIDEDRRDEDSLIGETSRARPDRPDVQALRDRGWKRVSAKQRAVLDEVLTRHDVTGPAFAAEVIRATPKDRDPLAAVMTADRMWQASQRTRIAAEKKATAEAKAKDRAEVDALFAEPPASMRDLIAELSE